MRAGDLHRGLVAVAGLLRAGDRDVSVGPNGFLQIFLAAADRALDRKRAAARSDAVAKAMKDVDFTKALEALPPYCLALMQNVSPEDQQVLGRALEALQKREVEPSVKALMRRSIRWAIFGWGSTG